MIKTFIPTPLRAFTNRQPTVSVEGRTVGEVLTTLVVTYPELKNHLFNDDDSLRSFINIYVNDEDVRHLDGNHTPVNAGDEISIVPSIAGG